jgi:hypothetical protein
MNASQYTPAVPRHWLLAIAGLLWTAVGVMLCTLAVHWLLHIGGQSAAGLGALGGVIAVAAWRFMFIKIAHRNIARIEQRPATTCFFAFQAWRSYGMMLFMIALGITLRHSHVSRHYLAVIYATIGLALFLASFSYHVRFWKLLAQRENPLCKN